MASDDVKNQTIDVAQLDESIHVYLTLTLTLNTVHTHKHTSIIDFIRDQHSSSSSSNLNF